MPGVAYPELTISCCREIDDSEALHRIERKLHLRFFQAEDLLACCGPERSAPIKIEGVKFIIRQSMFDPEVLPLPAFENNELPVAQRPNRPIASAQKLLDFTGTEPIAAVVVCHASIGAEVADPSETKSYPQSALLVGGK